MKYFLSIFSALMSGLAVSAIVFATAVILKKDERDPAIKKAFWGLVFAVPMFLLWATYFVLTLFGFVRAELGM